MTSPTESEVIATIVHLSDLHFGTIYDKDLGCLLLDEIPRLKPDILVVSGDLADNPRPRWFRAAASYLEQMRKECETSSGRRPELVVIPGNHDRKLLGNISLGALARMNFSVYFGKWPGPPAVPRWPVRWGRYFSVLARGTKDFFGKLIRKFDCGPSTLGATVLAGSNVILLSYDSNHAWLLAAGRVAEDEIRRTEMNLRRLEDSAKGLDPSACRIAVVHHHPIAIPYADKKSVTNMEGFLVFENSGTFMREMVKNDFDLVLHGHKHYSNFTRVSYQLSPNEKGEVGVLAAGTATVKGGNQYGNNSYNVIRVFGQGRMQVEIWEYGGAQGLHYASHTPYPFEVLSAEGLKQRCFRRNFRRHQIKAKSLTVTDELFSDGRSESSREMEGLTVSGRSLHGYKIFLDFDIGLMRRMTLNKITQMAGMTLEATAPAAQGNALEKKLKTLRHWEGTILFNRSFGRLDKPLDFGFSFTLVNGYAMTDREKEILYPLDCRTNLAGESLDVPLESTAQVVWFPIEHLRMRVKLPPAITNTPFVDVFRNPNIPRADIVKEGILGVQLDPDDRWERDAFAREAEGQKLRREGDNTWLPRIANDRSGKPPKRRSPSRDVWYRDFARKSRLTPGG